MVNRFELKPGPDVPANFPVIQLTWDHEADSYDFVVNGKVLPTLTGFEAAGLFLGMQQLGAQYAAQGDAGATEGPRPEQTGPRVPDGGV